MEKNLKAFFYDYKYYLFPENVSSLAELKKSGKLFVKRLKEENCMAPNFIYESVVNETVEIEDPDRLFEQDVNLYTAKEYDELLSKQVMARCLSCTRFVNDDKPLDLTGHYREMDLNGVCYEKEEKDDPWSFSDQVDIFWYRIAKHFLKDIAACIDKGNQKKLNKIINSELNHIYYALDFYGTKEDGKYHLYISVNGHINISVVIVSFIAAMANVDGSPMKNAGWEVHPFMPAKIKKYKYKDKDFAVGYKSSENPAAYEIIVYHPNAEKLPPKKANALYTKVSECLSNELGEDVFMTVASGLSIVSDKQHLVPMSVLIEKLKEKYNETYISPEGEKAPFPAPLCFGRKDEGGDTFLPYRNYIRDCFSSAPDASLLEQPDLEEKPWWIKAKLASFVYLYVPRAIDGPEGASKTLMWYLENAKLIPEPIRNPNETVLSGMGIGFADCAEHGMIIDNLIFDEKRFYRTMKTIAPVTRAYDVKMVVVNADGVMAYNCDYYFTPIDFN